jgi:hypothetical protein
LHSHTQTSFTSFIEISIEAGILLHICCCLWWSFATANLLLLMHC